MHSRVRSPYRASFRSSLGAIALVAIAGLLAPALTAEPLPNPSGREPFILRVVPTCPESGTPTLRIEGRFLARADKNGQPIQPKVTLGEDPRTAVSLAVTDFGFDFIEVDLLNCDPGTFLLTVQTATTSKDVEYDLFELTLGGQGAGGGLQIVYQTVSANLECDTECDISVFANCDEGFTPVAVVSCSEPGVGDLQPVALPPVVNSNQLGCRYVGTLDVAQDVPVQVTILCIEQPSG